MISAPGGIIASVLYAIPPGVRVKIGRGVEVAVALTLIGMILDRLTQALAERMQPPPAA